ncbi:MAG TPA: LamG-like jellyroll fold domain-containing protein [Verrucomicrobiae bacterium]|nr:LamG-like jellyroll fold domain-containing protein [Verrucomicrobiae bacterium]
MIRYARPAWVGIALLLSLGSKSWGAAPAGVFRAGAFAMDVTPTNFPVTINGGFLAAYADRAYDPLQARCLVLDDGATRVGLCVLDSCLIPREFADAAKRAIEAATGLAPDRVMISATHAHSAPALMTILGADADPHYPRFLLPRLVEGFRQAVSNLAPARVGWTAVAAPHHTHTRVWVRRPDRIETNPFGERSVRANMHPGYENPDVIAPAGPSDPALSLLSVQTRDGRPLAVLANYSMHYFGDGIRPVSADYYGMFADRLTALLGATNGSPAFVGIMSQGTSGDQQWMDYSRPRRAMDVRTYAHELAQIAHNALQPVQYRDWVPLAMRDRDLPLPTRQPSQERLAWARRLVDTMSGRLPKSLPEVYAREQLWLSDHPTVPVKLQALRVGELGLTMISAEVFAVSGLKIKALSPLQPTFNIELANGEDGYIPPPEHHALGSYNTWACRSAGLDVQAEPKIVEAVLALLEEVSGRPRRKWTPVHGPYARAVLAAKPVAYWRLEEFSGPLAHDASGHDLGAVCEPGVVFYLEGPESPAFSGTNDVNRAALFAGGRMRAAPRVARDRYSVEFWFWNGLSNSVRSVTGCLFSRGQVNAYGAAGDQLTIGGARAAEGRLCLANGAGDVSLMLTGRTELVEKTWNHATLVRDGRRVAVFLNGNPTPEINGELDLAEPAEREWLFFGGRSDGAFGLEGRLDEVAVYDRALESDEIVARYRLTGLPGARSR